MLPIVPHLSVLNILQLADIYLDAIPYNGATSLLDPLQIGLPPVVVEGNQLRFSQGAAILKEIGLTELITPGEQEYLDLAIRLGQNPNLRDVLKEKILNRMDAGPPFLDPESCSEKYAAAFKQMTRPTHSPRS